MYPLWCIPLYVCSFALSVLLVAGCSLTAVFCIAPNTHCSWMVSGGGDRQAHIFGFLVILLVANYIEISCGTSST